MAWDANHRMLSQVSDTIIQKVKNINKQMCLLPIDQQSKAINMLPELIIDSPVEYFWMIDGEFNRAYFIYITPYEVGAY